ncbi:protein zwilch homolog [Callorhinchus milii]|uniref:Protein zwilch n=1 Tax=Callorhinchus milii TaxID=7868 RepID=V9KKU8_CALMI|nr:protein zwilch homolog [Callorhinchus milii]
MAAAGLQAARDFHTFLLELCDQGKKGTSKEPVLYKDEVHVQIISEESRNPLRSFWNGNFPIIIAERPPLKVDEDEVEESHTTETSNGSPFKLTEKSGPLPLSVMKARQLISWYALAHNPNMSQLVNCSTSVALPLLWVRCDGSDPEGIVWLGAEPLKPRDVVTAMVFHIVTCNGPIVDQSSFTSLERVKNIHKDRHSCSSVTTKCYAQYDLFGSTVVENTVIESQSTIMVDFTWSNVESILEVPPLTSTATLNIRVESGDMRSPVFQIYKELEFLLVLAEGLKTGETEWPEVLEGKSAVDVVQQLIEDLKNQLDVFHNQSNKKDAEKLKSDAAAVDSNIHSSFVLERGDLDFAEQLWTRMRKTVSSYQDVVDCLTLVLQHLKCGDIQPWIHRGSNNSLSKLIQQSYHSTMPTVSVSGLNAIRMLLEIGLDKLQRDYINYFIGQELTTLNYLDYFLVSTVRPEEQVQRLHKLHHVLELVVTCSAFLSLSHENLFALTQSCIRYYKDNPLDERHSFQLPIRPTAISAYYQNEHPFMWRVEVISGHGQKEVKTTWQLNTRPPVDHVMFDTPDLSIDTTLNGDHEEVVRYNTVISCSQTSFT